MVDPDPRPYAPPPSAGDWRRWLTELHARVQRRVEDSSEREPGTAPNRWHIEWAIHAWASERLESAAVRIGASEGLTGPAPARWRLVVHIEGEGPCSYALAVLDGRAPLREQNVHAATIVVPGLAEIVATHGLGCWAGDERIAPAVAAANDEAIPPARVNDGADVTRTLAEVIVGQRQRSSGEVARLPLATRLAASLALTELGGQLRCRQPPRRRGGRRPLAFVATRNIELSRRALPGAEAALRKRTTTRAPMRPGTAPPHAEDQ